MSPVASALRTSDSGTFFPRLTRSSNGLFASSGCGSVWASGMACHLSVEGAIDDIHLLVAGQPREVHRIPRDTYCQIRVLLRVLDGVEERVTIEHVDVHVIS